MDEAQLDPCVTAGPRTISAQPDAQTRTLRPFARGRDTQALGMALGLLGVGVVGAAIELGLRRHLGVPTRVGVFLAVIAGIALGVVLRWGLVKAVAWSFTADGFFQRVLGRRESEFLWADVLSVDVGGVDPRATHASFPAISVLVGRTTGRPKEMLVFSPSRMTLEALGQTLSQLVDRLPAVIVDPRVHFLCHAIVSDGTDESGVLSRLPVDDEVNRLDALRRESGLGPRDSRLYIGLMLAASHLTEALEEAAVSGVLSDDERRLVSSLALFASGDAGALDEVTGVRAEYLGTAGNAAVASLLARLNG